MPFAPAPSPIPSRPGPVHPGACAARPLSSPVSGRIPAVARRREKRPPSKDGKPQSDGARVRLACPCLPPEGREAQVSTDFRSFLVQSIGRMAPSTRWRGRSQRLSSCHSRYSVPGRHSVIVITPGGCRTATLPGKEGDKHRRPSPLSGFYFLVAFPSRTTFHAVPPSGESSNL